MKQETDRKSRKLAAALAALALAGAAGLAHGQVAGSIVVAKAVLQVRDVAPGWSVARSMLGQRVVNEHGEMLGRVEDIIVAPDASVSYLIVGTGGFLGRRHDVGIPASIFAIHSDKLVLQGVSPELIKDLPAFEYAR